MPAADFTSRSNSRSEYEARMHRVLEHIDRHLGEPLSLDALAAVAHFSPFHFHRLFAAWMGETLGDYLRRRRLEVAAMRLIAQPRVPVLHIALSVGFGSAEAFARAFRGRFGCSPSGLRQQRRDGRLDFRNPNQTDRKIDQALPRSPTDDGLSQAPPMESTVNVKLIDRPETTVAYLRHTGPYGDPVSQFWQNRVYPWMVTNGLLEAPRYGISHDDPSITAPERCRYDAGVEVPPDFVASGDSFKTTMPAGRYAVLRFEGGTDEIGAAWRALLGAWLPDSGLQLDGRPCFEFYPPGSRFDPDTGVFDCEICVPVAPL